MDDEATTLRETPLIGPAIAKKLHAVLCDIQAIGPLRKEHFNESQKYKYLGESQIKELIQPLLVKHRVLLLPTDQTITGVHQVQESKQRVTDVQITYLWVDLDSMESFPVVVAGSGADSMDKGLYKALTGAGKQIICNTFCIPTGDDPEKDTMAERTGAKRRSETARATPAATSNFESVISDDQRTRLYTIATKARMPRNEVVELLGAYGYESSKEIKVRDYDRIVNEIESRAVVMHDGQ
jgi:hypothetical protein